jgi:superfamily II DNA or RNA helicase
MYNFQKRAFADMCNAPHRSLLLKAATGAGKTWLSLEYAARFERPILVMTKANVTHQFAGEVRRFFTSTPLVIGGQTPHPIPDHAPVVIIGHPVIDAWRDELTRWVALVGAVVIVDEVHELASSKRWEAENDETGRPIWHRLRNRAASAEDICAEASVVIGLSATPQRTDRPSIWGVLRTVFGEKHVANYGAWKDRYCVFDPGEYGGKVYVRGRNTSELREFIQPRTVVITKAELAAEIPPLEVITRRIKVGEQLTAGILAEFQKDARRAAKEGPQAMLELRVAEAAYRKRPFVIEEAASMAAAGTNVAVVVNRIAECKAVAKLVRDRLKEVGGKAPVYCYHGLVTTKMRQALQQRFMDKSKSGKVFVFTAQAGGTGLNLDNAHEVLIAALPTTPSLLIQLVGRFHRASTSHPVRVRFILAESTVDERLGELLIPRLEDVQDLLGDNQAGELGAIIGGRSEEELQQELLASLGLT